MHGVSTNAKHGSSFLGRAAVFAGACCLGGALVAPQASADNEYFETVSVRPETIYARGYRNQAEIDADVSARVENRVNPPVYDPIVDGARWTISAGSSSISNKDQMRPHFPHTSSGTLLLIWEARWDAAFPSNVGDMNRHKAFQLSRDTSGDARRIEIRTNFHLASPPDVAMVDGRTYVWSPVEQPMSDQVGTFTIEGDTWTRFWALADFDQRQFSLWIADEDTSARRIFDGYRFNNMSDGLDNFWFEFNSSQSRSGGPLDVWARNFIVLRNVNDVEALILEGEIVRPKPPADFTAN